MVPPLHSENNTIRTFSTVFAPLIHRFLTEYQTFAKRVRISFDNTT